MTLQEAKTNNPEGRNFWFTKTEEFKEFMIESKFSTVDKREYVFVLKTTKGGVEIRRGFKDSWMYFSLERTKELNEIEAICIRVGEKWSSDETRNKGNCKRTT